MSEKSAKTVFMKVPAKLLDLGLGPYEIAVFIALVRHKHKDVVTVFPSWRRLSELTGMKRTKLWQSLKVLEQCKIINWESGHTGVSNRYTFTHTSGWTKKIGQLPVDNSGGACG